MHYMRLAASTNSATMNVEQTGDYSGDGVMLQIMNTEMTTGSHHFAFFEKNTVLLCFRDA